MKINQNLWQLGLLVIFGEMIDICSCIYSLMIIIVPYLLFKSNELNIINTHEHVAKGLGVKVERERIVLFL